MSTFSITRVDRGSYDVVKDGVMLVSNVAYLRARRALHEQGVSGETHLDKLDGQPVGATHTFEVK